jgi:nicotinamidase-related amidase
MNMHRNGATSRVEPAPLVVFAPETALVIVDMQNDFCAPDGYYARIGADVSALTAAIDPVAALLARAREHSLAICFTRLVHDPARGAMEQRHRIRPRHWKASGSRLAPGSWGADIVDALRPRDGEIVIDKPGYSAFADTQLEAELRARGITTLIFAGVVTYACVLASAFAAFDGGFDVILTTDAVGSWNPALGQGAHDIVDLLLGQAVPSSQIDIRPTSPDGDAA